MSLDPAVFEKPDIDLPDRYRRPGCIADYMPQYTDSRKINPSMTSSPPVTPTEGHYVGAFCRDDRGEFGGTDSAIEGKSASTGNSLIARLAWCF